MIHETSTNRTPKDGCNEGATSTPQPAPRLTSHVTKAMQAAELYGQRLLRAVALLSHHRALLEPFEPTIGNCVQNDDARPVIILNAKPTNRGFLPVVMKELGGVWECTPAGLSAHEAVLNWETALPGRSIRSASNDGAEDVGNDLTIAVQVRAAQVVSLANGQPQI